MRLELRRGTQIAARFVTCLTLAAGVCALAAANPAMAAAAGGTLEVTLQQLGGAPLEGAAITLRRVGDASGAPGPTGPTGSWVVDQVDRAFTPEVSVVPVGASLVFPNSDTVSHQVYSFSPAKRFQLPLYRGKPYPPVRFDTPGIVTLGCNIHDNMIGWILVTDAPWFGRSDAQGHWISRTLAPGDYAVTIWHPRLRDDARALSFEVRIESGGSAHVGFRATRPMRAAPLSGKSREWDY